MFPFDSKIMIVDDSSFSRNMLKSALKEMKYWKIIECSDALEAQSVMHEKEQQDDPVSLLLLDIHMPDVNGLQFLHFIRQNRRTAGLPVLVITTSQEKREVLEAAALGVSHYVIKPYDTPTLKDKIATTWIKHGQKYLAELKAGAVK